MSFKKALPVLATIAAVVVGGSAVYIGSNGQPEMHAGPGAQPLHKAGTPASAGHAASTASPAAPVAAAAAPAPQGALPAGSATAAALPAAAQATVQQFQRLMQLPAGDAAIALAQELEAGITPDNAAGYVHTLFSATNPAAERAAIAALARTGDSGVMRTLADAYGGLASEQRGRVLQVLENAANPEALQGLTEIFAADRSEKRSALAMSALMGVAHIGTMDSVQALLSQITPANADYAFAALDRVNSAQGLEIIKGAATGSKDAAGIPARYLPALKRLAEARTPS